MLASLLLTCMTMQPNQHAAIERAILRSDYSFSAHNDENGGHIVVSNRSHAEYKTTYYTVSASPHQLIMDIDIFKDSLYYGIVQYKPTGQAEGETKAEYVVRAVSYQDLVKGKLVCFGDAHKANPFQWPEDRAFAVFQTLPNSTSTQAFNRGKNLQYSFYVHGNNIGLLDSSVNSEDLRLDTGVINYVPGKKVFDKPTDLNAVNIPGSRPQSNMIIADGKEIYVLDSCGELKSIILANSTNRASPRLTASLRKCAKYLHIRIMHEMSNVSFLVSTNDDNKWYCRKFSDGVLGNEFELHSQAPSSTPRVKRTELYMALSATLK